MTTMRDRILHHVKANPGLTSSEMRGTFALSSATVCMHLVALRGKDLIHRVCEEGKNGARWFYGPQAGFAPEPEDAEAELDELDGKPRRVIVTDWEAPTVAKQSIFAALGL